MTVVDVLFTCVFDAFKCFPKIARGFDLLLGPAGFPCTMAAAKAVVVQAKEPEDNCWSVVGDAQGKLTDDEDAEEVEEEFSCSAYCSDISRRQNEQRKAGLFCDVTLVFCSGLAGKRVQTLTAHRTVLSAASQYFSVLLGGQFAESRSGRVELKSWGCENGLDPETVRSVIQFMYTGEITVNTANVHQVLELADRFLLGQLKHFCGDLLLKKLNLSNCVAVHNLAKMYSLDHLASLADRTIRMNFHKVIHNKEFLTIPFHLLRDCLSDTEIAVESEQKLFEAILQWVDQNAEGREKHFEELFRLLRLSQISPSFLMLEVRRTPLVAKSDSCLKLVSDTLEAHAVYFETFQAADVEASNMLASQPRYGQIMDVIMVVGGVSDGGKYVSECVGYFVAEDRWVNLPNIRADLDGHAIAVTESHVYVAGSTEPGFAKTVERYNPTLNTWEQVSGLDSRKHAFGLTCVKDSLYCVGGHGNFSPGFKNVSVYKPAENEWHNLDPAPKILRDVKTVSVEDRYIYVMARTPVDLEQDDGLSTVMTCYDTQSQRWQDVDSLPLIDNYSTFQMAVSSTNFYHTATCCPKNYKVTAETAQQKISKNIPDDILDSLPPEVLTLEGAAVCHMGEDIFIIGGWRNSNIMYKQYRKEVYRYCGKKKRWMLLPPLPQPRCRAAACHIRIPYQYLQGWPNYLLQLNLACERQQRQQMQHIYDHTISLWRQIQSQIDC